MFVFEKVVSGKQTQIDPVVDVGDVIDKVGGFAAEVEAFVMLDLILAECPEGVRVFHPVVFSVMPVCPQLGRVAIMLIDAEQIEGIAQVVSIAGGKRDACGSGVVPGAGGVWRLAMD